MIKTDWELDFNIKNLERKYPDFLLSVMTYELTDESNYIHIAFGIKSQTTGESKIANIRLPKKVILDESIVEELKKYLLKHFDKAIKKLVEV